MFCAGEKPFQVPENKSVILAPTIPFPHIKPCWEFLLEHFQIQTLNMLNVYMVTFIIQSVCVDDGSVDPE